jgi:CDGSH-type Zn-finger protein
MEIKIGNSLKAIGEFTLIHEDGTKEIINGKRSFCRCGQSKSQPFCDNSHRELDRIEEMRWQRDIL